MSERTVLSTVPLRKMHQYSEIEKVIELYREKKEA